LTKINFIVLHGRWEAPVRQNAANGPDSNFHAMNI
jgi:hypothetical protein